MLVVPRYRLGIDELVHVVADIDRRDDRREYWTPMCFLNQDWLILKGSDAEGPPTCLACVIHPYPSTQ